MSKKAEVAEVYSAPLTKSAAEAAGKEPHERFASYLAEHLEKMFEDGKELSGFGTISSDGANLYPHGEKKLEASDNFPDLLFTSDYVAVIGEAKANMPDMNDARTEDQILAYVRELKETYPKHKKVLMLSAPYGILGLFRQKLAKIEKMYSTTDEPLFEGIDIVWVSEISDRIVEAPKGYAKLIESFTPRTAFEVLNNEVCDITEMFIPIEKLVLDPKNSRLLGFDPYESMTQEECYKELLADGNTDKKNDAVSRRIQMAEKGYIVTPIIVKEDGKGGYKVYDGNSRTAYAKEIRSQAAEAAGYGFIRAKVFGPEVSDYTLETYKQQVQSSVVLGHGIIQDAADMYRKASRGMTTSEIRETFNGKYSEEIIENSVGTITWLKNSGIKDDERIAKVYRFAYALYTLHSGGKGRLSNNGTSIQEILQVITAPGFDESWFKEAPRNAFFNAINATKQPWKIKAVQGFVAQTEEWATYKEWKKSMEKLEAENVSVTNAQSFVKKVSTMRSNVHGINEFLDELLTSLNASTSKASDKQILKAYSQSTRSALEDEVENLKLQLRKLEGTMSDIQLTINAHTKEFD